MTARVGEPGERRAWGWVAALRDGATTPWSDWAAESQRGGRAVPGAQQLELLRRLNIAGRPDADLVERVITASAPGRGSPDLELVGAHDESPFGPRPVDPTTLPDSELLRVATSLLAEDLVRIGTPPAAPLRRPRPWRTSYRLVGDPWLADPARAELRRRGHPPGGRRPEVLVLGTDLAAMIAHAWTVRAFDEGGPSWREWLAGIAGHDRLPPRADLERYARSWAERVGADRVRIVLDSTRLPRLTGTRRPLPGPPGLCADAVDLVRRVGSPLGLLVLPDRRSELLRAAFAPQLSDEPGPRLDVPAAHEEWVWERAAAMRDAVRRAGYAVHGDPEALLPDGRNGADPTDAGVLALAVRLLLHPGRHRDGHRGPTEEEER